MCFCERVGDLIILISMRITRSLLSFAKVEYRHLSIADTDLLRSRRWFCCKRRWVMRD